jgi:integrating conjugative element protein (TIGR03749 family)
MKSTLLKLFVLSLLTFSSVTHAAPKRIIYTGNPLKITLGVGEDQERRITFPDSKLVWGDISDKLKNEGLLKVEIINNNVYLTAIKPFKSTRNIFGKEGGSDVYLLDIKAVQQKVGNQRLIIVKGEDRYAVADKDKKVVPETVITALKQGASTPTVGFTTLFKFAAREVYAPQRLRGGVSGIYRESINEKAIFHLLRDNQVLTTPVAAWRSGPLHITALSVRNMTDHSLTLDPRSIRGHWKAALFHYSRIAAKGLPQDNTTLYLISKASFADAIASHPMIKVGRR